MAAMIHGVPMLCLPMGRDQHGNVARVEHLGLGHVLPADSSAADIAADRAVTELEALARPLAVTKGSPGYAD